MDEMSVRHEEVPDHAHAEGVADGSGLLEVEEVASGLVRGKRGCTIWEAHESLPLDAAEGPKKLMTLLLVDELG